MRLYGKAIQSGAVCAQDAVIKYTKRAFIICLYFEEYDYHLNQINPKNLPQGGLGINYLFNPVRPTRKVTCSVWYLKEYAISINIIFRPTDDLTWVRHAST